MIGPAYSKRPPDATPPAAMLRKCCKVREAGPFDDGEPRVSDADSNAAASDREVNAEWVRAVVEAHQTALLRHVVRFFRGRGDLERARDVVQDTFLKLWQADRAEIEPYLAQWLFTVSRNRALDVLRKERRMKALNGQLERTPAPPESSSPERSIGAEEGRRAALGLLEALPEKESEAIRLKLQAKLSYREIAEVMGLTVSHVGVLIHNGLKSIRAKIDDASPANANRNAELPRLAGGRS